MRIVAIVASYNEELFIRSCIENFLAQGVEVYLIDNESTDETVAIAAEYLNHGLIRIERFPRQGVYRWQPILRRKEEIVDEVKADWFIHADPDEIRLPPHSGTTIAESLIELDLAGFNAVNFKNFLFLPTVEAPDHEHRQFAETMLWYRYMEPSYPNQIKAWKRQNLSFTERQRQLALGERVNTSIGLAASGGHHVDFPGLKLAPYDFIMKHYQALSLRHAIRKYANKAYAPEEVERGWHGWKAIASAHNLRLPYQNEMYRFTSDDELNCSNPLKRTLLFVDAERKRVQES